MLLLGLSRNDGLGWSQLLLPHAAKFNFVHRLCSLGFHFTCPQENIITLPPSSAVTNPGPAGTGIPCPEIPSLGVPLPPFAMSFPRRRKATWDPQKSHPCLGERSPFSPPKYLFREWFGLSPPLGHWNSAIGGFCFLLAGKSRDFCAHAWFPFPVCVEPGCLGALHALRSVCVLKAFQNSQTEQHPHLPHPPGLSALAASIAGLAKTWEWVLKWFVGSSTSIVLVIQRCSWPRVWIFHVIWKK